MEYFLLCATLNSTVSSSKMIPPARASKASYMNNLGDTDFIKLANGLSESAYWLDWGELWTTPKPMNSK